MDQSATPILTDAYREPSLSGVFSTVLFALSLSSDLETVCPQSRVDAIMRRIEVGLINLLNNPPTDEIRLAGVDERQLIFFTNINAQSATALPASAAGTHMTYHDFGGILSDDHFFPLADTAILTANVTEPTPHHKLLYRFKYPYSV